MRKNAASEAEQTSADEQVQSENGSESPASESLASTIRLPRPLRIWPAILLVVSLWVLRIVPSFAESMSVPLMMTRFMGPLVCTGLILLWWLFFSRAWWVERGLGLVGLAAIAVVTTLMADKSVRGFGTAIYAVPWGISGFGVALIASAQMRSTRRTWLALLAAIMCFGFWDLVRTDEIRGDFQTSRSWRWQPTAEDQLLEHLASRRSDAPSAIDSEPLAEPEWPAFRGNERDGVQPGIVLGEDWTAEPPQEIWRTSVGPGWSSFSVAGNRLFTQEQRGDYEVVVCYDARSGKEVWLHQYESRFWEVVGGAGPRATPTLGDGGLFALGANGILNRLDPISGELIWRQDISQGAGRDPPQWGFASSPLVTDGVAIVHAGGAGDKGLLAYDQETGELRWGAPAGNDSYSSPQLSEIEGRPCVLMLTNKGLTAVDPGNGQLLGGHEWEFQGYRVVQPLLVDEASVLLGTAMGTGTQRVKLSFDGDAIKATENWTSRRMSPYYNDYVVHADYLYGFDNNIFACLDLETGQRKWKKGRYGNGQVLLLPDGDQLLVISEDGELVLLRATPVKLTELARHQVLDGRTWNHPVLIGNRLYVRNAEQAACFEMPIVRINGNPEADG